jgi:hypothetical protein
MVPLREDYADYAPPSWVRSTVNRLLSSLSDAHVAGLSAVVLTESAKISDGKSRRVAGKKYRLNACLGLYRPRRGGEPPAIFLIVDNILDQERLPRLQIARDVALGEVLFHEVGHHLHATIGSHASGNEAAAEAWERRLSRLHLRKRYWYLRPVVKALRSAARLISDWSRRRRASTRPPHGSRKRGARASGAA